jgi:hypothetical protein
MIAPLLVCIKVSFQVVGEKEQFQYQEHDGKFNEYDGPQIFTNRHAAETRVIKVENLFKNHHDTSGSISI